MNSSDLKLGCQIIFVVFMLIVVSTVFSMLYRAAFVVPNAALGVVEQTLDSSNIITQYETFYNRYGQIKAAKEKIQNLEEQLNTLKSDLGVCSDTITENCVQFRDLSQYDKDSINSINGGITGSKNQLVIVVEQYNVDAQKINKRIFNGTGCAEVTSDLEIDCTTIPYEINAETLEDLFYSE